MDNNKIINLEEARNILKFAKRIYRALDGVYVEYGEGFAYYPNELKITIPREFREEETTMMMILEHINKEFNAEFEYTMREMSIHAFGHEIGHHMDFEGKIMTQQIDAYLMADDYNRHLYDNACKEFKNKVDNYLFGLEQYKSLNAHDEEIEFMLEEKRIELIQEDKALDILYRLIPSEYAADEFSARFFMTYLKPYRQCNYNVL